MIFLRGPVLACSRQMTQKQFFELFNSYYMYVMTTIEIYGQNDTKNVLSSN